jgi:hypothetical protein
MSLDHEKMRDQAQFDPPTPDPSRAGEAGSFDCSSHSTSLDVKDEVNR